jgi:hypothetical protein
MRAMMSTEVGRNMIISSDGRPEVLDSASWEGVNILLDVFAKVRPDDRVVIAYSPDSRESAAWVVAALRERNIQPRMVGMRPLRDTGFLDRLNSALPSPEELPGRLLILTFERDTMSHNGSIRAALSRYDSKICQVVRAMNAGTELFSLGFRVSPEELSARNAAILERCMSAEKLRVETAAGTSLQVQLDNRRFRWISNRGVWRPGKFVILPAGEVATFPAQISGTLIADFAINVNTIMDQDARLDSSPVRVQIEQGRLSDFTCQNANIERFLSKCFSRKNARYVGELGFGTNCGIGVPIALNSHINERRPGVHIGFGQHNQTDTLTGYSCDIHTDLIARGGRVWVDDEDGPIDLEDLAPSSKQHPVVYQDEDVFSEELDGGDCCGALQPVQDAIR